MILSEIKIGMTVKNGHYKGTVTDCSKGENPTVLVEVGSMGCKRWELSKIEKVHAPFYAKIKTKHHGKY